MIAALESWKAGLFGRRHFMRNLGAGLVVGVVALPLAMAFAIASGARPEQGIYTGIVAGLLASLFGSSRVSISGPTGAFIVILAGITAQYGIGGLQIATLMAGLILLAMGLVKLGGIIRFIPTPVITGFTAGIAVIIFVGQWKDFFGLAPAASGQHFHEKLIALVEAMPGLHLPTMLLALGALVLVVLMPRVTRRIPSPLVAMLAATLAQAYFQFDGVATIGSAFGGIPSGLPELQLPEVTFGRVLELIGPAFTIAMLGAIESLLCAVVADGMTGTRHNPNQELIGQGIANLATPFFGGFAATGAIARTATNIRNGGNSPLAGIVHALVLLAVIVALAPLAAHIPLAALAAILFVVAWNMSEARHFVDLLRHAPANDRALLLITFLLTVFADLVIAVNVGVLLAALLFMKRMSETVTIEGESDTSLAGVCPVGVPKGVQIYSIDGPLFFGAAATFERTLAGLHDQTRVLILRLGQVPMVDATAMQALADLTRHFQQRGVKVLLCEANARINDKLANFGLLGRVGQADARISLLDVLATVPTEPPAAA
ncbi:SulP family inorganic anion transporter [Thiobacillus sp. 65-1402]|uniref:SulP family inorganic anion transporter n=1 Tax=Thiobacillus sp. 65-1402 TaxID=1895861 RepID=UPI0009678F59|nr:SulP family inorganic anion transporter [Thiobacillus sp. 65-1402]OJW99647.1 MAG: sodium-independent anion transporter [Thiobacillus sp. 65-1402]